MRSSTIILLLAVSFCALSGVNCRTPKLCPTACTREYKPVCATWNRNGIVSVCTFSNACGLRNQVCSRRQAWKLTSMGECAKKTVDCKQLLKPIIG